MRLIDFIAIPKEAGDVVVLLLVHPGVNLLGRYLPPSRVNDLLLADASGPRFPQEDVHMANGEEADFVGEAGSIDIMDLASFLEYVLGPMLVCPLQLLQVCDSGDTLLGSHSQIRRISSRRLAHLMFLSVFDHSTTSQFERMRFILTHTPEPFDSLISEIVQSLLRTLAHPPRLSLKHWTNRRNSGSRKHFVTWPPNRRAAWKRLLRTTAQIFIHSASYSGHC